LKRKQRAITQIRKRGAKDASVLLEYKELIIDKEQALIDIYNRNISPIRNTLTTILNEVSSPQFVKTIQPDFAEQEQCDQVVASLRNGLSLLFDLFSPSGRFQRFIDSLQRVVEKEMDLIGKYQSLSDEERSLAIRYVEWAIHSGSILYDLMDGIEKARTACAEFSRELAQSKMTTKEASEANEKVAYQLFKESEILATGEFAPETLGYFIGKTAWYTALYTISIIFAVIGLFESLFKKKE
jgi:hypothetical protein